MNTCSVCGAEVIAECDGKNGYARHRVFDDPANGACERSDATVEADKAHRALVRSEAVAMIVRSCVIEDEDAAQRLFDMLDAGEIPHVKVIY